MVVSQKSQKNKNIESLYPLSPMQEGILFHTLYDSNSSVYFEQILLTLSGQVNQESLKQSWQQVVQRHGVLRTMFVWEGRKQPLQVVRKQVDLPWSYLDWQELSLKEQQQKLEAFVRENREKGFQLNQAPLMRCTLIRLGNQTYKLIWSFHHILMDGWCLPIIIKELLSYYEFCNQGNRGNLPPVRPYQDYILWLQQQNQAEAEEFWRQSLEGFTAPTPLVVERTQQKGVQNSSSYQEQQITLGQTTTKALRSLVMDHRLTMATLVQAAWALLLSRYSGKSEVLFGVTVSGRPGDLLGVEKMVGLFINTLPLRVQAHSQAQLIPWLQQLNQKQLQLQGYSYSPLVEIQRLSKIPTGVALFQSILAFENYPIDSSWQEWSSNLKIADMDSFSQTNYPLTVTAALINETLGVKISYDTSRFEADTITRMLGHLQTLLEAMVANPNIELGQLPLMKEAELDQILVEWNNTKTDYPDDKCIHQLFEEQVEKTPDAVAVVFEDEKLTYAQLNSKANQLAHYLQSLGVKPETLVGICVERSVEMVVSLLSILKAGGAYVPLDPNYPPSRLNYMVEDARLPIILTQEKWKHDLPQTTAQVICLEAEIPKTATSQNLKVSITSEHQAYMMYTSGSTGLPKGVNIRHQGVVRLVKNTNYIKLTEEEIFLQLAPISFDAATFEIWGSLLNGGTLVVMPPHKPSLGEIGTAIRENQVTTLWLSAGLFQLMVEEQLENLKPVKQLLAGGDVLSVTHVQKVVEKLPGCQLINGYGPTENTTFTCCFPVKADSNLEKSVPIGKPISNTQVYILDSNLQPVPIGVPGELHIGGDGLAIGYHNRPELTSEKFIPNPFDLSKVNPPLTSLLEGSQKSKLYKTGDLARYLGDGNIEFLGRIDQQVKIRGYRIETGEIEAVLNSYPTVKETVVVAREDNPGEKRLVAYIVSEDNSLSTSDLRHFLQQKLPDYMVPSAFVILEALPLTPNGKVDRKALPAPEVKWERNFLLPRNPVERQLAQIWSEVLNVYPISIQDNFFDLGGHSLIAVRLMSQIEKQFGKNLPLATIFKGQTIEQLASILQESTDSISWSALVPIQPNGNKRPFFLVPGGGGNVVYYSYLARYLSSDQPFYGLQAIGLDGESEPYTQVEDIAAHNIQEIQSVQPQGPYLLGGHSFGGKVAFEMALQLQKQGQEIALLAILDTTAPEPGNKITSLGWNDAMWILHIGKFLGYLFGKELELSYEALEQLTPDDQLNYLFKKLQQINFYPPGAGIKQLRGFVRVFKANNLSSYFPEEVYPTPITLFRAINPHSEKVMKKELTEYLSPQKMSLPDWGWNQFSNGSVEICEVPGDHISMIAEPHVQVLAQKLMACIEQAQVKGK
ncbi:hypothetical protein BJP34_14360 [Moorena producens PAL-8-15-08-1]|uniref:Carrier domain-containing protein n=1 Tax=Moorena producens PAL-8-15-08-1 TaxID=1458985 RepID=A0A1D8U3P5_9CYAN|nr:non-ribosomal peptide synthetase [Moorena producens]AOX04306.1 hypothetical protein BJP34_14360 [Moorena producens PAL-8-15-08-1]